MTFGVAQPQINDAPWPLKAWISSVFSWFQAETGVVTITAAYNVAPNVNWIRVNATSAPVTATLGSAVGAQGRRVYIKKIDASANAATLAASGSQTIDGGASINTTTQYAVLGVISNGANWDKL